MNIRHYKTLIAIFSLAITTSTIFCFLFYPLISKSLNVPLDIDGWGTLGKGLYHFGTLSFYPNPQPSIYRGPIYPTIIAFTIWLTGSFWLHAMQIIHIILFALTCCLVYFFVRTLASKKAAWIAAAICAIHPYLLWFIPRLYTETLSMFLITWLAYLLVQQALFYSFKGCLLIGVLIGILILNKQVFLPFLFIIPLIFLLQKNPERKKNALLILVLILLVISPWTYRNWKLTHTFIPVQTLFGYNLRIGDGVYAYFNTVPLNELWNTSYRNFVLPYEANIDKMQNAETPRWMYELALEKQLFHNSFAAYQENPLFFLKKLTFDAWGFWFLGTNQIMWPLLIVLQSALLILFLYATYWTLTAWGLFDLRTLPVLLVWACWTTYLPVMTGARFSLILIPIMISYCSIAIDKKLSS